MDNVTVSMQNIHTSTCEDPPTKPNPVYIAKASIAFLFVVLSLPMNILTICALWKNFRKSPSYAFIINLCLSNIFFALFVNNLDAVWNLTVQWYAGNIACKICQFFKQFSLTWSSTAVTCISLDRCLTLLFPLLAGSNRSTKRAALIIIPSLIANFLTCAPAFALYKLHDGKVCNIERYRQCVDFMGNYTIEQRNRYYSALMTLQFIIPAVVNTICSGLLIYEVAKMIRTEKARTSIPTRMIGQSRKSVTSVAKAKRKLERLAVVLIFAFCFCYGPYYGHALLTGWGDPSTISSSKALLIWVQSCLYLVPLLYSLVFCSMLSDVREYARNLFDFSGKIEARATMSNYQTSPTMITRFSNRPSPMPSASGTPKLPLRDLPFSKQESSNLLSTSPSMDSEKLIIPKRENGNVFTTLQLDEHGDALVDQSRPRSPRNFIVDKL
ncbi:Oidioi.mRNA.OKI2018_I69.chr2.g4470.t2.cds [Oikopleura dioica]|uniref:Oidioi.mRNA.OKI2018_I69.chr2.g4470.t2.cds n=1 Tax=Oikopleura dioica TaxID=34765 RepID=A0ABN7T3W0_OIKDI|nr:Oidioi.mRNA.OKI2018_I69.chr2.g4470.t2.cds [Oikopleura dioica]